MGIGKAVVGLIQNRKQIAAVGAAANEAARRDPAGPGPAAAGGFMGGFLNVVGQLAAPRMAVHAPNRGGPLPGSDPAVVDGSAWSGDLGAGAAGIAARDAAFDVGALQAFAEQVFAAVAAVLGGSDAGTVRPVMSDELWQPLAAVSGLTQAGRATKSGKGRAASALWSGQRGQGRVSGLYAGQWYDSAQVSFTVTLEGLPPMPPDASPRMAAFARPWPETWLFQRSAQPGGNPMARPEACPACGAPTQVGPDGACTHCRQPVPYLTAGWLVTAIASRSPMTQMMEEQMAEIARNRPEELQYLPPSYRQFLQPGAAAPGPGQRPQAR